MMNLGGGIQNLSFLKTKDTESQGRNCELAFELKNDSFLNGFQFRNLFPGPSMSVFPSRGNGTYL